MVATEKLDKKNKMLADLQAYHTEHGDKWTEDREAKWKEMNADYDAHCSSLAREERLAELENKRQDDVEARTTFVADGDKEDRRETAGKKDTVTSEDRDLSMRAWLKDQRDVPLTDAETRAVKKTGMRITSKELRFEFHRLPSRELKRRFGPNRTLEQRADNSTVTLLGGEFIPEGFVNSLEESLLAFGNVRGVAQILRTESGNDLPWPTTDDTGNTGELLAENTAAATQAFNSAAITLKAFKYSSKLVTVSQELLEDSAINIPGMLGGMLGTRIARITNVHFTTGTDSAQPEGVNAGASTGKTAAGTATVTFDELIDLLHSVDPSYRDLSMGTSWMFTDLTAAIIRKLKDGNANFLWQPSVVLGQPDTIYNFPVHINQQMPEMTTGLKPITFGAFQKYIVRDIAQFRLRRLDERFAEKDQVGFVAFSRHDGRILDAGTDPFKNLLMA